MGISVEEATKKLRPWSLVPAPGNNEFLIVRVKALHGAYFRVIIIWLLVPYLNPTPFRSLH